MDAKRKRYKRYLEEDGGDTSPNGNRSLPKRTRVRWTNNLLNPNTTTVHKRIRIKPRQDSAVATVADAGTI